MMGGEGMLTKRRTREPEDVHSDSDAESLWAMPNPPHGLCSCQCHVSHKKAVKLEELWNKGFSRLIYTESLRYNNLVATDMKKRDRNRVASHGANTAQSLVLIANSSWKSTGLLTQYNVFDYRIQPIWNS